MRVMLIVIFVSGCVERDVTHDSCEVSEYYNMHGVEIHECYNAPVNIRAYDF